MTVAQRLWLVARPTDILYDTVITYIQVSAYTPLYDKSLRVKKWSSPRINSNAPDLEEKCLKSLLGIWQSS